jgi:saccharopine dehydrogenase (NAD+, L-lysine-forming)
LDASEGFGEHLIKHVIGGLLQSEFSAMIKRSTIAEDGHLTERFAYLADYVA